MSHECNNLTVSLCISHSQLNFTVVILNLTWLHILIATMFLIILSDSHKVVFYRSIATFKSQCSFISHNSAFVLQNVLFFNLTVATLYLTIVTLPQNLDFILCIVYFLVETFSQWPFSFSTLRWKQASILFSCKKWGCEKLKWIFQQHLCCKLLVETGLH